MSAKEIFLNSIKYQFSTFVVVNCFMQLHKIVSVKITLLELEEQNPTKVISNKANGIC